MQVSINLPKNTIEIVDQEVIKIGCGATRSGWVNDACLLKVNQKNHTLERLINKLKAWQTSFPKKPFKELMEEIENGEV